MKSVLILSIFVISVLSRGFVLCQEDETEEIVEYFFDSSQSDVQDDDVQDDDSDVTSTIVTLEGDSWLIILSNFNLRYLFLRINNQRAVQFFITKHFKSLIFVYKFVIIKRRSLNVFV